MVNNLAAQLVTQQGPIMGIFRLRDPEYGFTRDGRPYMRIRLEDMSGHVHAYGWQERLSRSEVLNDLTRIYIEGRIRQYRERPVVDLTTLFRPPRISPGDVVRLIPHSVCPLSWLLPYLDFAVSRITLAPLKQFVESVLGDDGIAFPFVSAPGSLNHHHNYPGGLLRHSLECFGMAEKYRQFPKQNYELGLVATLFHDIGKILTLSHEMKRTSLGSCIEHDKLTFEVLGPYLKQLDRNWSEGARELRYLLNWKVKRPVPRYNMADVVACCDRVSAGLDRQKRA